MHFELMALLFICSVNGASGESNHKSLVNAEREVILNHCFDDVERFMSRLQQVAEAQSVLNQRKKKNSRSSKKKKKEPQEDDLLTIKACPPPEEEFVDIFQKIKYSFSLLDRLKSSISPDAPELLHYICVPLRLLVSTTGGPALASSIVSPALTSGAITLLQKQLTAEEHELWTSLGSHWTSPCSQLSVSVPPYAPVFLDGWRPQAYDSAGQPLEDPIELQHKVDAFNESRQTQRLQDQARQAAEDGNGFPESERYYCCSYDFVARNSSELSVLKGETLEVIDSSKRWWKCQNSYGEIGFVPFNILEPLSALNKTGRAAPLVHRESKVQVETQRGSFQQTADNATSLNYDSSPSEVEAWLTAKGFMPLTIQSLRILNGAQLFALKKEEFVQVSPEEGAKVYSKVMEQKTLLEDARKASELDASMEMQKLKINSKQE
uniref:EPS8 signaling adaptor L1a n=1 Tax=Amphilophus citrinellus TaxID=61819 RepID=A0A3Q0RDB2_AMPCI